MAASLTPHLDAAQAAQKKRRAPHNEFERAVFDVANVAGIEIAKIMDYGQGTHMAANFAVSCAATILGTVAASAASGAANEPELERTLNRQLLSGLARCLLDRDVVEIIANSVPVDQSPEGRA